MIRNALLHQLLPFLVCLGLLVGLRSSGLGIDATGPQSTTVAVGFLFLVAYIGGHAAAAVGLPRITGYLAVGMAVGPYASNLLTRDMMVAGRAVEGVAVALIALTAGGEIRLEWVRAQARRLTLITLTELTTVTVGVMLLVWLLGSMLPFIPANDPMRALVIAFVFGAIAVANSPTVTIAVIAENAADGPLSRTVLGVTVLKDVCVIVLFAVALAVARSALGESDGASLPLTLLRELGGSIAAGLPFGIAIAWFIRRVDRDTPVFILGMCYLMSEVASVLHLEALLVALTAGFYVENFSSARGHRLIAGIERLSLPVYALFFAAAGAKVDLGALWLMWPVALLLAGTRAVCVWAGTRLGATLAGAEPVVVQYGWLGFISQAGVTLALSSIVARAFPDWGPDVQVVIIAMIALHEFVGPIGFQYALRRAGEVGAATRREAA